MAVSGERVMKLFRRGKGRPFSVRQVAEELGVPRDRQRLLLQQLRDLAAHGRIAGREPVHDHQCGDRSLQVAARLEKRRQLSLRRRIRRVGRDEFAQLLLGLRRALRAAQHPRQIDPHGCRLPAACDPPAQVDGRLFRLKHPH